jgi:anaerobic dimethyl sulfoxide reductase subunit B (iron-sulfur subunit)
MQIGFYFDQTRCTGCYACVVACKDWHDVPAGPASWRQVTTMEQGEFPDLFVAFFTSSCYHCAQPACVAACPAGAITKREEDGVVLVDRTKCLGKDQCDLCWQACSYKAPQFGAEPNAKMQMCNLCLDRLEEGKKPICVDACPMRALDAGPLDELKALYGDIKEAEGFLYSGELEPSIVFKPKVKAGLARG